ncbi:MAG: protein kinase [Ruminococcus sp.]|nr:protein kinase [Ruminococcus sp.]
MPGIIDSTYEIIEKLGAGGGGNVYLARHIRLNKKVVLKIDKRKLTTKPEILRREVDVLKNLKHANIPQVYDFFVEDDSIITVMDFIEGESLDKPLKRGEVFSQPQVIEWARQLLDALDYMHSPTHGDPPKGYVHSDIKPANVMRLPDNSVCLIDFNISLAIGEYSFVGRSVGYASPEHYGLDYSNPYENAETDDTQTDADVTQEVADDVTQTITASQSQSQSSNVTGGKRILPDVRSDIYSLGATLYHMLSGYRPPRDAKNVVPLPKDKFSPQLVDIISKAMTPNPDLRFQTAAQMLEALNSLRKNDPRAVRLRRAKRIVVSVFSILLVAGLFTAFVGLKRIQRTDEILKNAEYSHTALEKGDINGAIDHALAALPNDSKLFDPPYMPQAQKALTDALGVYELSDEYKPLGTVSLDSAPLYTAISPDGKTGACICSGKLVVFDTGKCSVLQTLDADPSALSEVEFIDDDKLAFAGKNGICVYDFKNGNDVWSGDKATAVAVSRDGKTVMGIYRDEGHATVYDAKDGSEVFKLDFDGGKQKVLENDSFANPHNNLAQLSNDGRYAAVSLDDGRVLLADISSGDVFTVFDDSSYTNFAGCFTDGFFGLVSSKDSVSEFELFDLESGELCAQSHSDNGAYGISSDGERIYLKENTIIVCFDPKTGEKTTPVDSEEVITRFDISDGHIVALSDKQAEFYTLEGVLINKKVPDSRYTLCSMSADVCIAANEDEPAVQIFGYERNDKNIIAQ